MTDFAPEHVRNLVEALRSRKLIIFAGAGLSSSAQVPGWEELVKEHMPSHLISLGLDDGAAKLIQGMPLEYLPEAASIWWKKVSDTNVKRAFFTEIFKDRPLEVVKKYPEALANHQLIAQLDLPLTITTNYDVLFETAAPAQIDALTHTKKNILDYIQEDKSFLFKLHGCVDDFESIIFTSEHYGQQSVNAAYQALLGALSTTYVPLFLGYGGSDPDINRIRQVFGDVFAHDGPRAYIVYGQEGGQLPQELDRSFIPLLFDSRTDGYQPITNLLQTLVDARSKEKIVVSGIIWHTIRQKFKEAKYHEIPLHKIGRSRDYKDVYYLNELYTSLKTSRRDLNALSALAGQTEDASELVRPKIESLLDDCQDALEAYGDRHMRAAPIEASVSKDVADELVRISRRRFMPTGKNLIEELSTRSGLAKEQVLRALFDICNQTTEGASLEKSCSQSSRALVVGQAGTGKTTLARLAAWACFEALDGRPVIATELFDLGDRIPIPIYIRLENLEQDNGQSMGPDTLLEFAAEQNGSSSASLAKSLTGGEAWLLFDGLDEINVDSLRDETVQAISALASRFSEARFLLTARPHALKNGLEAELTGFTRFDILPLDESQHFEFANRFMRVANPMDKDRAEVQRDQFLSDLYNLPKAKELATTPLMLTTMAVIHEQKEAIPDKVVVLYRECLSQMLKQKEAREGAVHRKSGEVLAVDDITFSFHELLKILSLLAYEAQRQETGKSEVDIAMTEVAIRPYLGNKQGTKSPTDYADAFLRAAELKLGLLVQRGHPFRFAHPTFREYLAALHISNKRDSEIVDEIQQIFKLSYWRNVICLVFGILADTGKVIIFDLFEILTEGQIANQDEGSSFELLCLALQEIEQYTPQPAIHDKLVTLGEESLAKAIEDPLAYIGVGDCLGTIGEPEIDPLNPPVVEIFEGIFSYGGRRERREIQEPYLIGTYPVTNKEFQGFLREGGYREAGLWSAEGWAAREQNRWSEPGEWRDRRFGIARPQAPVVAISWYEAEAYCKWLKKKTKEDWRLPEEFEWERAARGTDGRNYPWGNAWDLSAANSLPFWAGTDVLVSSASEPLINPDNVAEIRTSRVGLFRQGKSPTGCYDMAGNVWEWCNADSPEQVLKGGSWDSLEALLKCSSATKKSPDWRSNKAGFRLARKIN